MLTRRDGLAAVLALLSLPALAQPVVMRATTLLEVDPAGLAATRVMREAYRHLGLGPAPSAPTPIS